MLHSFKWHLNSPLFPQKQSLLIENLAFAQSCFILYIARSEFYLFSQCYDILKCYNITVHLRQNLISDDLYTILNLKWDVYSLSFRGCCYYFLLCLLFFHLTRPLVVFIQFLSNLLRKIPYSSYTTISIHNSSGGESCRLILQFSLVLSHTICFPPFREMKKMTKPKLSKIN